MHSLESGVEDLIEETVRLSKMAKQCKTLPAQELLRVTCSAEGDDSTYNMDTTGLSGLAIYAQHVQQNLSETNIPQGFNRRRH